MGYCIYFFAFHFCWFLHLHFPKVYVNFIIIWNLHNAFVRQMYYSNVHRYQLKQLETSQQKTKSCSGYSKFGTTSFYKSSFLILKKHFLILLKCLQTFTRAIPNVLTKGCIYISDTISTIKSKKYLSRQMFPISRDPTEDSFNLFSKKKLVFQFQILYFYIQSVFSDNTLFQSEIALKHNM